MSDDGDNSDADGREDEEDWEQQDQTLYCRFSISTKLEAKSESYNMTVVEYFRDFYHQRIKERVTVLICLERFNAARIRRGEEEVKRVKLNDSSSNSVSVGEEGIVATQPQQIGEFRGVLAEKMITAFELWREILGWL